MHNLPAARIKGFELRERLFHHQQIDDLGFLANINS